MLMGQKNCYSLHLTTKNGKDFDEFITFLQKKKKKKIGSFLLSFLLLLLYRVVHQENGGCLELQFKGYFYHILWQTKTRR